MRSLLDILSQTMRTLWSHKLRSFLTMFGIAWGVGSLLLLVGLGEGFRAGNRKQFEELGENVMFVFGGRAPAVEGSFSGMRQYYLTDTDAADIVRECPHVKASASAIHRGDIRAVSECSPEVVKSPECRPTSIKSGICLSQTVAGSTTLTSARNETSLLSAMKPSGYCFPDVPPWAALSC
jgi:hypothetical protein